MIPKRSYFIKHRIHYLPSFSGPVAKEDRSKMNAVFILDDTSLEKEFPELCKQEGMIGVVLITDLMKDFANRPG